MLNLLYDLGSSQLSRTLPPQHHSWLKTASFSTKYKTLLLLQSLKYLQEGTLKSLSRYENAHMNYNLFNEKLSIQVAWMFLLLQCDFAKSWFNTAEMLGLQELQHQKGTFQSFGILEVLLNNISNNYLPTAFIYSFLG